MLFQSKRFFQSDEFVLNLKVSNQIINKEKLTNYLTFSAFLYVHEDGYKKSSPCQSSKNIRLKFLLDTDALMAYLQSKSFQKDAFRLHP